MSSVHVAVGVITNREGHILIALRPETAHQGGLWEFPGGKVAEGESLPQALTRELHEELGITVERSEPLIQIAHDYGDKSVLLDVHKVTAFSGVATGNEGQPIQWVAPEQLVNYTFPAANRPIITAITLPDTLLITGPADNEDEIIVRVDAAVKRGLGLVQLRCPQLTAERYAAVAERVATLCAGQGARLQLNTTVEHYRNIRAHAGLHLNRWQLHSCQQRPVADTVLLGASCHNAEEIQHARRMGVDYICLSPVAPTASHPGAEVLGWDAFARLSRQAGIPVYALGGMGVEDITRARNLGGQGIAGISFGW